MTGAYGLCGGIATANKNILHALVQVSENRGYRLRVISLLENASHRPKCLPPHVNFQGCAGRKRAFSLALLRCSADRPTICFDHVTLALPVLPLAASGLVSTVIFAHGSEVGWRMKRTSGWSLRAARKVLTNSSFTLRNVRKRLGSIRGEACPLGLSPEFDLNVAVPDPPASPVELEAVDGRVRRLTRRFLLLVARLDPAEGEKGHAELIAALPGLLAEFPDVQLVFPGPGDGGRPMAELARRHGVAHAVFMPGRVSLETLQTLYRACYAYVMPSRQEGFGLVYLEAMNYGKPCVGCLDDGAEEVVVPGETGWLVRNPSDAAELGSVLKALLSDPQRAANYGRNGFRRLHERFTSQHYQDRVIASLGPIL